MGAFRIILSLVTACLMVENCVCMANSLPYTFPLGKIGCLYADDVCTGSEVCINDDLFGNCQLSESVTRDPYKYAPDSRTLSVLVSELRRLIDAEFSWSDGYTQCVLQHLLVAARDRQVYDPRICERGRRLSQKIDDLDAQIAALLRDLYESGETENSAEMENAAGMENGKAEYGESEQRRQGNRVNSVRDSDSGLKRNLRIHKYNADTKRKDSWTKDGPVPEMSDTYDQLSQLSSSDLRLLQMYLQAMVPAEADSQERPPKTTATGETTEYLSDIAPSMTPRYANMLAGLLLKKMNPEDLNDDDLHMISEIMSKMVANIQRDANVSKAKNVASLRPFKDRNLSDPLRSINLPVLDVVESDPDEKEPGSASAVESENGDLAMVNQMLEEADHNLPESSETDLESGTEVSDSPEVDSGKTQVEKKLGLGPRYSEMFPDGYDTRTKTPSPTTPTITTKKSETTKSNDLTDIDLNYAFIILQDRVGHDNAVHIVNTLEKIVGVPQGTLEMDVDENSITVHVPPDRTDITVETIAKAAVSDKNRDFLQNQLGVSVVEAGYGDETSRVTLDDLTHQRRYFVLTFVLCGTIAIILVSVVVIYLVRRHGRSKQKLASLARNGDAVEASKDYQDLCRQRMQAKSSEKPEPINAASRISSVSESQVRSPSSRSSTSSWSEEPVVSNMDISTGHIVLSYMESHLKNKDRLDEEWRTLSAYEADPSNTAVARDVTNARKNRFADILPYDHSRVMLTDASNITQSDYINASTITDHDPRNPAYIATQAPLPHTVADFWQMVWEQGSAVIVMLTKMTENGLTMCHRYWPEEGSDLYHIYEVHLVSEHIWCDDYLVRSFYLKNVETNETRTVTQFHFLTWPDSKPVPAIKSLLDFRRKVNKSYRGRSCPVVVHCSDGSGRTGTYCLVDMVLNRLAKGAKEIDIAATLEHIRDQRMAMVKTKEHFEFALACVAEEVHAILKALPH